MAKVDIGLTRALQKFAEELGQMALDIRVSIADLGDFCQDCGETDPLSGFYPMEISGPDSVSPFLCNACELARRDQTRWPSHEGGTGG